MKQSGIIVFAFLLVIAFVSTASADSGRIYGKIITVDGDVYEGLIRWDKNEGSWCDILNGDKESHRSHGSERRETVKIFGITIGEHWDSDGSDNVQSGICFGHIKTIEPLRGDAVRLTLKSGEKVRFEGGSTDLGDEIRGIVIEDAKEGEVEFDWDEIEKVELSQGAADLPSAFGDRLYGTLKTRAGDEYTGWVGWDLDELFTKDVLDGEYKDRSRKVPFGRIKSIERRGSSGATVNLTDGEPIVLRETNDVDDSNRGICVYDPGVGLITAGWDEFEKLEFKKPPAPLAYDKFDGGKPLAGTVYTASGEKYTGTIRWDDDEEFTWEILDGEYRDLQFDVVFGSIKSIEPSGFRGSIVTTWDGRSFKLRGSNDVDDDNNGIYVTASGEKEIEIEWDEVERVEFSR